MQWTAYVVRISDWSSDVCSSDLLTAVGYPGYGPGDGVNARPGTVCSLTVKRGVAKIEVTQTLTPGMSGGPLLDGSNGVVGVIHKGEIGRASCRERVCQYV